jgi:hypothetical protein
MAHIWASEPKLSQVHPGTASKAGSVLASGRDHI